LYSLERLAASMGRFGMLRVGLGIPISGNAQSGGQANQSWSMGTQHDVLATTKKAAMVDFHVRLFFCP
jgi:hypothetical protein